MKTIKPLLLISTVLMSFAARAEEDMSARRGWYPFLGVDTGYQNLSTSAGTEVNKSGLNFDFKLLGSYYNEDWIFDLGLGYDFSNLSGSNAGSSVSVKTDSVSLDFAPRYRLGSYASIGPVLSLWMGTDESYSETVGSQSVLASLGAQLMFDVPTDKGVLMRAGVTALESLNLSNRNSFMMLLNFQIGFDAFGSGQKKRVEPVSEPLPSLPPPPAPSPSPSPSPTPVVEAPVTDVSLPPPPARDPSSGQIAEVLDIKSVVVRFPEDRLLFEYKMSHLEKDRRAYITSFGKFLAKNPEAWESVTITGYTDKRGTPKVNNELSTARARTVFEVLLADKVPQERMRYRGLGAKSPIDRRNSANAWKKNRRVELVFHGVNNPKLFTDQLNEIDNAR